MVFLWFSHSNLHFPMVFLWPLPRTLRIPRSPAIYTTPTVAPRTTTSRRTAPLLALRSALGASFEKWLMDNIGPWMMAHGIHWNIYGISIGISFWKYPLDSGILEYRLSRKDIRNIFLVKSVFRIETLMVLSYIYGCV